jgi:polyisoprenoid-binding protein YceI
MTTNWKLDPTHSGVHFSVRHLMVSKVRGAFKKYDVDLAFDPKDPASAKVEVRVDVASIDTHEEKRDAHLRSADFFDAEKFPTMTFKSSRVEVDGADYKLHGDLTLHGVTKPLVLAVEFLGEAKDPWGNAKAGFSAQGSLSRKDFDLHWNQALETGGVLVGDKVEISIDLEVLKSA